jgi:hypothetical protein
MKTTANIDQVSGPSIYSEVNAIIESMQTVIRQAEISIKIKESELMLQAIENGELWLYDTNNEYGWLAY